MLESDPTREQLLENITKLEDSLRAVERWSTETYTDLTAAGYEQWARLVPRSPPSDTEIPLLLPPDEAGGYELDKDVNTCLRAAIDGSAAVIQKLAVSFHPRRGEAGLSRDLDRAKQIVRRIFDDIRAAQAALDRKSDRTTH